MALGWIASFKNIPWTTVISVAPSIVDGARMLWSSVAKKDALDAKTPGAAEERTYSPDSAVSAVEKQVHLLELRVAQLREEIVLSSEIIDKLAEQQSQLVHAVDILRVRTRALLWLCVLLGLAVMVLFYLGMGR